MHRQNQEIYTLDSGGEAKALLKQKVFSFGKEASVKKAQQRKIRVMSSSSFFNPEPQQEIQIIYPALKPKLPSKKLFDQPRFFLSLERRKGRIISGLRDIAKFQTKDITLHNLRGKKMKYLQSQRKCSTPIVAQNDLFQENVRTGWEPKGKTPYLNYNMQYLIKKRKSHTPAPSPYIGLTVGPQSDRTYYTVAKGGHA